MTLGGGTPTLVSVIVPVYNGAAFVAEAIESVLAQDHAAIEIIAVDDGSIDDSARILAGVPRVQVIHQPNAGVTRARNVGIEASRGELVAFIDQDDRWRPGKLARQVRALNEAPAAGYSLGHINLFVEPGSAMPSWMGARGWMVGTERVGYMPGTMVVRRSVFDRLGLFDERFQIGSDADWLIRARDAGIEAVVVPEVVLDKRIHSNNLSGHPSGSVDMLSILAESIRRRRAAAENPE